MTAPIPTLIDTWLSNPDDDADGDALDDFTRRRRTRLQRGEPHAGQRSSGGAAGVPVLAVVAPVVTDTDGVIEYPGDPMCLYAALRDNVAASVTALHSDWADRHPIRDTVLDWGALPDTEYRATVTDSGIRTPLGQRPRVSDELVFDPRVWNNESRRALRKVLDSVRPEVLLISGVSAAHRYALDIAEIARQQLPDVYIILGGRHADETMRWFPARRAVDFDYSSTVSVLHSRRRNVQVNAVISGDGSPLLDLLSTAILLTMDSGAKPTDTAAVGFWLRQLHASGWHLDGKGVITLIEDADHVTVIPVARRATAPTAGAKPTAYAPFAIRSHFTIFPKPNGEICRTAHFLTAPTCPFQCTFCSESAAVAGPGSRLGKGDMATVLSGLAELVSYGAEAVFFDDPVMWSGRWETIDGFAAAMRATREMDDRELAGALPRLSTPESRRRWRELRWGGQLTIDVLLDKRASVPETLAGMRRAGCTYVYIGIESMSEQVMTHVRKNLKRRDGRPWKVKVRQGLARLRSAGIPVGTSVLFGLDGETRESVDETIEEIGRLVDDSLVILASPNILTYHPGTGITRAHGKTELDYHSPMDSAPPYTYFEEAYEGVVTRHLTTEDIWHIHLTARQRWGDQRNASEIRYHALQAS